MGAEQLDGLNPKLLEFINDDDDDVITEIDKSLDDGRIDGENITEFRCKMTFPKSNEASIEQRHCYTRTYLARAKKHSEAYPSIHNRKHELQAKLLKPDEADFIVQSLGQAGSGSSCLSALHMQNHPRAIGALRADGLLDSRFSEGAATRIIYGNDPITQ